MWAPWTGQGQEILYFYQDKKGVTALSSLGGINEEKGTEFTVHYSIVCDPQLRLRTIHVKLYSVPFLEVKPLETPSQIIDLSTDGEGTWHTEDGEIVPLLQGCLYADITATPFTNTLPIRRLKLKPRSSATIKVVYITIPQMSIEVVEQRYTCLKKTFFKRLYRFESLENRESVFTADLPVDRYGLVVDYPGLFRRI